MIIIKTTHGDVWAKITGNKLIYENIEITPELWKSQGLTISNANAMERVWIDNFLKEPTS